MACSQYNPDLPHNTAEQQQNWLKAWEANLLNDPCLQRSCGHICLGGDDITSMACMACLEAADCPEPLACSECIDRDQNYQSVFDCTFPPGLSTGELLGIILGTVFGSLLLIALIFFILYKTDKLPVRTRLWIDNIGKKDHKISKKERKEFIHDSKPDHGQWGGNTGPTSRKPWEYTRSLIIK
jgi:hypothetical protein